MRIQKMHAHHKKANFARDIQILELDILNILFLFRDLVR